MGLDMYLTGEKVLSANSRKERKIISYLNSLVAEQPDLLTSRGLFLSEYDNATSTIRATLNQFKLIGQVGDIDAVKINDDGNWVVYTESMYWRKANHIHNWFVHHIQQGIDDCGRYGVTFENLSELQALLKIAKKCPSVLPPASGFFFGSTTVDEMYFFSITRTLATLRKILKTTTQQNWNFNYYASW